MKLSDLIPDADAVLALEPDELGLAILQVLVHWPEHLIKQVDLDSLIHSSLGPRPGQGQPMGPGPYPANERHALEHAIREAWHWLEGQALLIPNPVYLTGSYRLLSRRARKLGKEPDPRRAFNPRRLPKETLHPNIREDVWGLYHRGKLDTAVFEAMKAVEVAVRDAAGFTAKDIGTALMRAAFDVDKGPLTDMQAERAERQARSDMFAGAIGSYKNPHSHRNVALDDPHEAAEIIMLATICCAS
jgi:uncharacterized protein (TIGR02391 family)